MHSKLLLLHMYLLPLQNMVMFLNNTQLVFLFVPKTLQHDGTTITPSGSGKIFGVTSSSLVSVYLALHV